MHRFTQDRITALVRNRHISLLAEWVNIDGRLAGSSLKHDFVRGTEGNWWTVRSGEVVHPSVFPRSENTRIVAVVDGWGKQTSIVAFCIHDPATWRKVIRSEVAERGFR
jgi:hypothetical protein